MTLRRPPKPSTVARLPEGSNSWDSQEITDMPHVLIAGLLLLLGSIQLIDSEQNDVDRRICPGALYSLSPGTFLRAVVSFTRQQEAPQFRLWRRVVSPLEA